MSDAAWSSRDLTRGASTPDQTRIWGSEYFIICISGTPTVMGRGGVGGGGVVVRARQLERLGDRVDECPSYETFPIQTIRHNSGFRTAAETWAAL